MRTKAFEALVEAAIASLPESISSYLDNVIIVVMDAPDEDTISLMGIEPGDLMGLYLGSPLDEKSFDDWGALPDEIQLYREAILAYAREMDEPVEVTIRETILHEIGHHFGLDEDDLARLDLD